MSYGVKFSNITTQNTFDFYNVVNEIDIKQLDRSNNFAYTENVNAGYINYQRPIRKKWSMQTGLRMENTNSNIIKIIVCCTSN